MAQEFKIYQYDLEEFRDILQEELSKNHKKSIKVFLTNEEVCELLKITIPTLYSYIGKGYLNQIKLSDSVVRYDYDDVIDFIESRKLKAKR
jgi:predicted DNA-binding transcriptional regulator AlpA